MGLTKFNNGKGGYDASATTIDFGEEGFTSSYEDELKVLYEQLGGSSVSSYTELKAALAEKSGKKITAAEINTQNGEDLVLTLGGLDWKVVYVSEAGSGDVIVTLWLAGSNDKSTWNKFYANNTTYKYPSAYYSTSYVRSVLNGTSYAAEANTETLTAGEQDAKWSSFLSVYGDYITTPSQVPWQEKEKKFNFYITGQDESTYYNVPNEAYGVLSGNWYSGELTDFSSYLTKGDKFENSDYGAWANDKLWLPSLSETGFVHEETSELKSGIWQTSVSQNANALTTEVGGSTYTHCWLRSGSITSAGSAYCLSGFYSTRSNYTVTSTLAVRPAMHLNLRSVAMAVSGAAFEPVATPAAQGFGETNDGLIYSAEMQGAVKFNPSASNFLSADWKVGDTTKTATAETLGTNDWLTLDPDTGIISVKNAGTYTFWFTLKDDYEQWEGADEGDNAPRSVTITVQPKTLKVLWDVDDAYGDEDEGWYWNYNGQNHGFTPRLDRTQPGINWDDLGTDNDVVSVRYREKNSEIWTITAPKDAGVYTVAANLNGQNPNYVIEESEWEEFTINKLNISIKWSGTGSLNDAADGLHWIYDGKNHPLTATIEGLISDDTTGAVTVSVKYSKGTGIETADGTLIPKEAGSYIAFAEVSGDAAKNYNLVNREDEIIEYAEQPFKITQRVISVTWVKNTVANDEYKNTYKWTYSGYADRTDFSNTDSVIRYTLETEADSISGDTGIVGGLALTSTIGYATVTGGVVGAYDSNIRLDVGTYCVKVSITDKNYVLDNDVLEFSIEKRKVNIEWTGSGSLPTEDGTIAWRYDGLSHVPTANAILTMAEVSGGANLKDYIQVAGAEKEVTAIKGVSNYVATVSFKTDITDENFNADNYQLVNASVDFKIIKGLITDVSWFETVAGEKKPIEGTPSYTWGVIKGKGPGYSAVAKTKVYNASGDEVEISFNLLVSYPDANYADGVEWAVNDVTGYKAVAKLDGPSTEGYNELSQRFEFLTDGEADSETYIVFLIKRKAGEKDPVNIQWVVYVDNTTYYTLAQLEELGGAEIKINGGGYVFVKDGKFNFYYSGNPQAPSAHYVYREPDKDGNTYETLDVSDSSVETNAGDWTAVLAPSSDFAYGSDEFECDYVIVPLNVKLTWTNTTTTYNGKLRTPTATLDTAYVSAQAQWYKDLIANMQSTDGELAKITATGYINAGDYTSEAQLGDNFAAVDGTNETAFKINPFAVAVSGVKWEWNDGAKNDTINPGTGKPTDPNAWYWVYDGKEHAPVPSLETSLDGTNTITLTLLVTGATKEVGEHYAFAWLDPNDDNNKNFMLVVNPLNPVSTLATQKFSIAKLEIDNVYWKGEPVDESWTGAYVTVEGTDYKAVDLGTAEKPDLVLAFVFNGNNVCALPFYMDVAGNEVPLTYEGAMRNVGNGPYTVRITNDFTFKDADGNAISTVCRYVILPKQLEVIWLDNEGNVIDENTSADKLVWEYNGLLQNPEIKELTGVDGNPLAEDTDYTISGWKDAGKYVSELKFINKNYSVKNSSTQNYSIKPRVIEVEWTWDGIAEDEDGNVIPPVFSYNAAQPDISVSALAWAGGLEDAPATLADGKFEIEIEGFGKLVIGLTYENLVDYVGKHTVKAVISDVKLQDDETGDLIAQNNDNYVVGINAELVYEIEAYVIYVDWSGTGEDNDVFEWTYDGINSFAPTATYALWDGETVNAQVSGARMLAGDYVASVTLPEALRTNCVFAKLDENGELDWENGASCGEHAFKILKAEVEIEWKWTNGAKNDSALDPETNEPNDPNAWYWVYDGTAHAPEAYNKGTGEQLEVTGAVIDAGENYVASASLPDAANYKFKDDDNQTIFKITVRLVWVNWVDESEKANDEAYAWFFDGNEHAPRAILADKNGDPFLIDGKTVDLIVSGSARNCGTYTATAEIASSNYAFADDEDLKRTQVFKIVQLVLDEGDFWWDAEGLANVNYQGKKDDWYNYIFNGDVQYPVAETEAGILFAYTFEAINEETKEVIKELAGISDAGTYKVTVTIVSTSDYALPAGLESVYVNIAPMTVDVDWDVTTKLYYNGGDQSPKAYYTDNFGNVNELEVTVDGAHALPDVEYTAKADFIDASSVKNYVLGKHVEHTYKIEKRSIRIEWDEEQTFMFNNEGHYVKHTIYINDVLREDIFKLTVSYVIKDSKGNVVKIDGKNAQEVINAGEYVMVIQLDVLNEDDAEILKYYTLADDTADAELNFVIKRKELIVTADSFIGENAISYGDKAPTFTAVIGQDVEGDIVGGLVDGDDLSKYEGITVLADGRITGAWLDSSYVEFAEPGMYDIIVLSSLGVILSNYEIISVNGQLEVIAAPGTIIWHNDRNTQVENPNFVYNGKEQKPDAYIFDGEKNLLPKLTLDYIDEEGNVITDKAINAGTYRVRARIPANVTIAENSKQEIEYTIFPKEVVVNIDRFETTYGDRELSSIDGSDILTETELKMLWSYDGDKCPVGSDDLEISFSWNVEGKIINGFLQADIYYIKGNYNGNPNYIVFFEGLNHDGADPDMAEYGLYVVNKADITDTSKRGTEWYFEERIIDKYETYFITLEDKAKDDDGNELDSYRYITFKGDQSTEVKFSYSHAYLVGRDEIPEPDDEEGNEFFPNTNQNHPGIREIAGEWIINYRIEIDNHNTYYGRWRVLLKFEDEYIVVIFLKPYEIEYGTDVPENLTEILVDEQYVTITIKDESVLGDLTAEEYFKAHATAYVPLGYNKYVTNRTKVGSYTINFELDLEADPETGVKLDVIYKRSNADEASNIGMYKIVPRQLQILWGETEFTYDGNKHAPMPAISHWISDGSFILDNIANGKEYLVTDGGITVKVVVYTEGNFVSSGGHKVTITVDDPNYTILTADAVQTISIKGAFPWWLVYTVGALALASLIAFIIMAVIMRRRKMIILAGISDDEGFYDPIAGEEDETGLSDPYYAQDYNDGFDYNKMWNDVYNPDDTNYLN
ncbi:MAG: hypothetical protein HDP34_01365 [Clostridia bacterium]|nr:hypothetical protein [Clostridia bacterium]